MIQQLQMFQHVLIQAKFIYNFYLILIKIWTELLVYSQWKSILLMSFSVCLRQNYKIVQLSLLYLALIFNQTNTPKCFAQ